MNTKRWLGLYTAGSPYDSPPGSAQVQNNLQIVLPGRLAPRPALSTVAGLFDETIVLGLYRISGGIAADDLLFAFVRTFDSGVPAYFLAVAALETFTDDTGDTAQAYAWNRQQEITASADRRPTFCEDRHGNVYVLWGHGIQPVVRLAQGTYQTVGLEAPKRSPTVSASGTGFFIERIDVINGGGSYSQPPNVVVQSQDGTYSRQARARAIVQNGNVVDVEVVDGGSNYTVPPQVVFDDTVLGTGFEAITTISAFPAQYGLSNTVFFSGTVPLDPPQQYNPTMTGPTLNFEYVHAVENFDRDNPRIPYAAFIAQRNTTSGQSADSQGRPAYQITSVEGLAVNDLVVHPDVPNGTAIVAIAVGTNTISLNNTATALSGQTFEFLRVRNVPATLLPGTNEYIGTFPVGGNNTGQNATTALEFVDSGVVYSLSNFISVTPTNAWFTGTTHNYWAAGYNNYGLMGSHTRMYAGWQNRVNSNRSCSSFFGVDFNCFWSGPFERAFFTDYSFVSYYLHTGNPNDKSQSQWQIRQSAVAAPSNSSDPLASDYREIDVELQPTLRPDGTPYNLASNARLPRVRIKVAYAPLDWNRNWTASKWDYVFVGGNDVGTIVWRSGQGATTSETNYPGDVPSWWAANIPRPLVDLFNPAGSLGYTGGNAYKNYYGYGTGTITLIDAGYNLPAGAQFRIRLCQGRSNHEHRTGPSGNVVQDFSGASGGNTYPINFDNNYYEFTYNANQTSIAVDGGGPPTTISNTAPDLVSLGNGYQQNQSAFVQLLQRPPALDWTFDPTVANGTYLLSRRFTWNTLLVFANSETDQIGSVTITSHGVGYYNPPEILQSATDGTGAVFQAYVDDEFPNGNPNTTGAITRLVVLDGGRGYRPETAPRLFTSRFGAKALPVLRPAMRGTYRCTYRYTDRSQQVVFRPLNGKVELGTSVTTLYWPTADTLPENIVGYVLEASNVPRGSTIAAIVGELANETVAVPNGDGTNTNVEMRRLQVTLSPNPSIVLPAEQTSPVADGWTLYDPEQPVIYSNFAPIVDLDCGPNIERNQTAEILWALVGVVPPSRADSVEFYRTSGDQSLVFYRLQIYGTIAGNAITIVGRDTLSDEELFDYTRSNYAAVPLVLPSGELNAFRFGQPRSDMRSCCAYQDRMWYAASTSGRAANSIYYSEYDEFESSPPENELAIQNNDKVTDYITCLIPFGSALLIMQAGHTHSLTYNTSPSVDADIQLLGTRGCVNPQCWQIDEDILYCLDETGIYAMDRGGGIKSISDAITNFFVEGVIDFTKRDLFHLTVDHKTKVLRAFVCNFNSNSRGPNVALCYSMRYQVWWTETYPTLITSSSRYKLPQTGKDDVVYGSVDGNAYRLFGTTEVHYRGLESPIVVTNPGSGYTTPPAVRALGGAGAVLESVVRDGRVVEILILNRGTDFGVLTVTQIEGDQQGGNITFNDSVTIEIEAPPAGGTQATATATALFPRIATGIFSDSEVIPPEANNVLTVGWRFKTANMELAIDNNVRNGDRQHDRSITVLYKPTDNESILLLREYYNNSQQPRENVMPRNRGTGFIHDVTEAKTTLNMAADRSHLGLATGIATANFAARGTADLAGTDRHVAVELLQESTLLNADAANIDPPLIYGLTVSGVIDEQ